MGKFSLWKNLFFAFGVSMLSACEQASTEVMRPPIPGAALNIERLDPAQGPTTGNITVAVHGSGFSPNAKVFFDNTPAKLLRYVSENQVEVQLPKRVGKAGKVSVRVEGLPGTAIEKPGAFAYFFSKIDLIQKSTYRVLREETPIHTPYRVFASWKKNKDVATDLFVASYQEFEKKEKTGTYIGHYFGDPASTEWNNLSGAVLLPHFVPMEMAVADLNKDSLPDFVISGCQIENQLFRGDAQVYVLLARKDGLFDTKLLKSFPIADYDSVIELKIALGDVNGDGNTDILLGGGSGNEERDPQDLQRTLWMLKGTGTGDFEVLVLVPVSGRIKRMVTTRFQKQVGADDVLLLLQGSTTTYLQKNRAFETIPEPPIALDLVFDVIPPSLVVDDFNQDGQLDVVVSGKRPKLFLGGPDQALTAKSSLKDEDMGQVMSGDFDHDGILDLVSIKSFGAVQVWRGQGDGTFAGVPQVVENVLFGINGAFVEDFDGDGYPDVVYGATDGKANYLVFLKNQSS